MIEYINKHNKANMTLVMSTPGAYTEALKKENIVWPVKYDDVFPYANDNEDYWVGYFSSRPGAKKQVKDASAFTSALMKLMSFKAIRETTMESDIARMLLAKQNLLQELSIYIHHDAITGTAKQYVADDYAFRMQKAVEGGMPILHEEMLSRMLKETGI